MRIPTRQRISYKQARNTICIALLLGITFSFFLIYANYYRVINTIEEQVQSLANISHDPASRIAYNIDIELAKEITKEAPLRIVFRDNGFKDDTAKVNVKQLLKQLSPETEMKVI